MSAARSTPRGTSLAEGVVAIFLVCAVLALGYVYFFIVRAKPTFESQAFDLRNSMLDAELGECVVLDTIPSRGRVGCLKVRSPGVVIRPRGGPPRLGVYRGLKRARPYLVSELRHPPPGRDCSEDEGSAEILLFDLNAFGMPHDKNVSLDLIVPRWVQKGGRYLFVYEAQMSEYGQTPGKWLISLHEGAPLTGAVLRRHVTEKQMQQTLFTPAEACK